MSIDDSIEIPYAKSQYGRGDEWDHVKENVAKPHGRLLHWEPADLEIGISTYYRPFLGGRFAPNQ